MYLFYLFLDYPKTIRGKDDRISKSKYLKSFFKKKLTIDDTCYVYDNGAFNLIGCSLTEISKLEEKLKLCDLNPQKRTLILTECSTTYMENDECQNLFQWLTIFLSDFIFISYEQIREALSLLKNKPKKSFSDYDPAIN